ncbi:unnamed protein product [Rotaria magnacalcarata]|uniref:Uncharacterized protein n=1 Tax=Rotaria magnacalcarata TaxID=392030 RepID=A0A816XJK9_9BILA|nr:unnamed protein product [Rotaria magnacalcarata]
MNEGALANLLDGLCNNKALKKFIGAVNKLNNQHMECIGHSIQNDTALKELDLNQCDIDDEEAAHLTKCFSGSRLENLCLSLNSIGDHDCGSLLSFIPPTLKKLAITGNQITESSLQTILTSNRTLKIFWMNVNPVFGEDY